MESIRLISMQQIFSEAHTIRGGCNLASDVVNADP